MTASTPAWRSGSTVSPVWSSAMSSASTIVSRPTATSAGSTSALISLAALRFGEVLGKSGGERDE